MLDHFMKLGELERNKILLTLKIIIKKIDNNKESSIYSVFLEQLTKKTGKTGKIGIKKAK